MAQVFPGHTRSHKLPRSVGLQARPARKFTPLPAPSLYFPWQPAGGGTKRLLQSGPSGCLRRAFKFFLSRTPNSSLMGLRLPPSIDPNTIHGHV